MLVKHQLEDLTEQLPFAGCLRQTQLRSLNTASLVQTTIISSFDHHIRTHPADLKLPFVGSLESLLVLVTLPHVYDAMAIYLAGPVDR